MKKSSLKIISAMLLLSGSAMADLQLLSLPATTPNRATISVAAGEVVELHGKVHAQGTTPQPVPAYEIQYTVGTITHRITNDVALHVAHAFPGPGTLNIYSNNTTTRGFVVYRIVPASDYAKNVSPSHKFMATAQSERSGTIASKEASSNLADVVVTAAQPPLVTLKK